MTESRSRHIRTIFVCGGSYLSAEGQLVYSSVPIDSAGVCVCVCVSTMSTNNTENNVITDYNSQSFLQIVIKRENTETHPNSESNTHIVLWTYNILTTSIKRHDWFCLVLFCVISIMVCYLIPNLFYPYKSVKLVTLIEGDPKVSFSIATTPKCREGCYSFPWITRLYPGSLPYNVEC